MTTTAPKRPVLRYHGGKWRIAPWIISHFPKHHIYVEPFCGAASVLLRKERSGGEVINDRDGQVVNLFRILRDPAGAKELERQIRLTPFAREEFDLAYETTDDPIESARRMIVRAMMGFGSSGVTGRKTGFRGKVYTQRRGEPSNFTGIANGILKICDRLQGVVIENMPAINLIGKHDSPETLFYVDPPYVRSTRNTHGKQYRYEMTDAEHWDLAMRLQEVKGMVVLSGYRSDLYDTYYRSWTRTEKTALADRGAKRVEVLWMNEAAVRGGK